MNVGFILSLWFFCIHVRKSAQDCRVAANCDDGNLRWHSLGRGEPGPPGKKGATGPSGQKGEPGLGVNITELKEYFKGENRGPKLYYYAPSLTWDSSKTLCEQFDRTLCTYDQLCVPSNGGRKLVGDVLPGNHWVAILDSHNDWVTISEAHTWACRTHREWGPPSWGTSTATQPHKGYVYCCETQSKTERTAPAIRYQYIGKSTTYASSREHCENQGRRLCYSSEACSASVPRFGKTAGNNWIAVNDRYNEWIQIGVTGRTCGMHGIQHGLPSWGVREDGSLLDYVGFVYCCKKTSEN